MVLIKTSYFYQRKKKEKEEKLVCSIEDKEKYVTHIRALKQEVNHGLILKDVHRVNRFVLFAVIFLLRFENLESKSVFATNFVFVINFQFL